VHVKSFLRSRNKKPLTATPEDDVFNNEERIEVDWCDHNVNLANMALYFTTILITV
jgi:hypothetical protein